MRVLYSALVLFVAVLLSPCGMAQDQWLTKHWPTSTPAAVGLDAKALALGAKAVCIGRPYVWGLAAFGQSGVEAALGILRRELQLIMRQAGTTSVEQITQAYLADRRRL